MADIISGTPLDICRYLMQLGIDPNSVWDLCPHKEKRSLNSNNYYWQLLEKIAVKTHEPKSKLHNINLRHLGLAQRIGDKPVFILLPDTDEAEEETLLADTFHLAPRSETKQGIDGQTYRYYYMLKGSSDMNVQEFSALLDLALQDAKTLGIDIISADELKHIRQLEMTNEQKHNSKR
jgi:hypothetical protein